MDFFIHRSHHIFRAWPLQYVRYVTSSLGKCEKLIVFNILVLVFLVVQSRLVDRRHTPTWLMIVRYDECIQFVFKNPNFIKRQRSAKSLWILESFSIVILSAEFQVDRWQYFQFLWFSWNFSFKTYVSTRIGTRLLIKFISFLVACKTNLINIKVLSHHRRWHIWEVVYFTVI